MNEVIAFKIAAIAFLALVMTIGLYNLFEPTRGSTEDRMFDVAFIVEILVCAVSVVLGVSIMIWNA